MAKKPTLDSYRTHLLQDLSALRNYQPYTFRRILLELILTKLRNLRNQGTKLSAASIVTSFRISGPLMTYRPASLSLTNRNPIWKFSCECSLSLLSSFNENSGKITPAFMTSDGPLESPWQAQEATITASVNQRTRMKWLSYPHEICTSIQHDH